MALSAEACARRPGRVVTLSLAFALALWTGAIAAAPGPDETPPTVLALSAEAHEGQLEVRVRVVDDSGAGSVLFHVRGPRDEAYRVFPMNPVDGGDFRVSVPFGGGDDDWLVYYVEATDRFGNGPGLSGSAEEPFHAVPRHAETAAPDEGSWAGALLLAPSSLLLVFILFQPGRRQRNERFWIRLLAPISDTPDAELDQAIADLCAARHHHPERGPVSITPKRARRRLDRLKATRADSLKEARESAKGQAARAPVATRSLADASEERIREELFWFHMLQPLVDAADPEIDKGLRLLTARRHFHPEHGWRIFGAAALRSRLDDVRGIDPRELFDVARHLDDPPRPLTVEAAAAHPAGSSGTSLVELVVVLALLAGLLGMTALAFKPLEAPLVVSGDLTDSLLRQARARSVSRTFVHRVRPLDADSLIAESSSNCGSVTWSLEQDMSLDLPQSVTISDTAWSVCFDSRGFASENVIVTFDHPEFASRQLEILRGGTTRWLP